MIDRYNGRSVVVDTCNWDIVARGEPSLPMSVSTKPFVRFLGFSIPLQVPSIHPLL